MNRRIILIGPAAAGKDFLKRKFEGRGFRLDVSYTTRPKRAEEIEGKDYYYYSEEDFQKKIDAGGFYEWVKHGDYRYGTGQWEWDYMDIFIMETDGIKHIKEEDRKSCFVILLDPPEHERIKRMRLERRWDYEKIQKRLATDKAKFQDFKDYDMIITDPYF